MKKKLLTLLLTISMSMGIVACGQATEDNFEDMENEYIDMVEDDIDKEMDTEITNFPAAASGWTYKTVECPYPELIMEDVPLSDSTTVRLFTTPFNIKIEDMYEVVKNHPFFTDATCSIRKFEDCDEFKSDDEGDFYIYECQDMIFVDNKEGQQIFSMSLSTDYSLFKNINDINIHFYQVDKGTETQEQIRQILSDILGEEIADYLVYNITEIDGEEENFTEVIETTDDATYYSYRTITPDKEKYSVDFAISVSASKEGFFYYNGGQKPGIDSSKYGIDDISNISVINYDKFTDFLPELNHIDLGAEFLGNSIKNLEYSEFYERDGSTEYQLSIDDIKLYLKDVNNSQCPVLNINYIIREKEDAVKFLTIIFEANNIFKWQEDATPEEVLNKMKEQVSVFYPDIDLSGVVYSEGQSAYELRGGYSIFNEECSYEIIFDIKSVGGEWKISLNKY